VNYFKEYFNQPVVEGDIKLIYFYTAELKLEKLQQEEINNIVNNLKNNKAPREKSLSRCHYQQH